MHIAQQSRRERLRIQQQQQQQQLNLHPHDPAHDVVHQLYTNTCLAISNELEGTDNIIPDHLQRLRYNAPSEMVTFTTHSQTCNKISRDGDPKNFNTWKSINGSSHETRDHWATICNSPGLVGHPMIVGGGDSSSNIPSSYMNHHPDSYDGNQSVRSEIPSRIGYKHYRDVQFICPSINQTVTYDSGTAASFTHEICREPSHAASWESATNEVSMVPDYAQAQAQAQHFTSIPNGNENENVNVNAQGLSLSLSTMPLTKQNQCRMDEKLAAGPLGPFTGYETILKTSKYLNPARQLLHELCICATAPEISNIGGVKDSHDIIGDGYAGGSANNSPFGCSSNDKTQEAAGSSSTNDSCRPDYLQKKEKLLYMQEEVCRRYKHYHQQMQMVVSSFESVAGLSSATPYISVALKAISKLFHNLRNAISDHLKSVKKALGEDISSPTTGASSSKCDKTSSSMFKLIDNPYRKHPKPAVNNLQGLYEPQQHVWRPQRGLPERAVAILRTWLFDHFLHPYPTDSDKHMLASQTGLTRNQVSNWFINARVRIWKPMVEEIHSLETKATAETGSNNAGKNDKKIAADDGSCTNDSKRPLMNTIPTTGLPGSKQVEYQGYGSSVLNFPGNHMNAQAWNQEGSIVDFVPYLNGGMDLGGFGGAVSLTLGLRQNGQPPPHLLQQQPAGNHLRRHCGDQIVYDFVG